MLLENVGEPEKMQMFYKWNSKRVPIMLYLWIKQKTSVNTPEKSNLTDYNNQDNHFLQLKDPIGQSCQFQHNLPPWLRFY